MFRAKTTRWWMPRSAQYSAKPWLIFFFFLGGGGGGGGGGGSRLGRVGRGLGLGVGRRML